MMDIIILTIIMITMMIEVGRVRGQLQELLSYDWLSVPLVYTQTVGHNDDDGDGDHYDYDYDDDQ